ncbi:MAG: ABC transporter substrate-binding protein [Gammaproteobacteria bacterium]|nr:ABC transporter substrate-binding protein [Gammaproteobacteria bacterium]
MRTPAVPGPKLPGLTWRVQKECRLWASALLLLAAAAAAVAGASVAAQAGGARVDAGERLYRTGLGANGEPIAAIVQGDVVNATVALACANCHKRSGLGTSEGRNRAPPITAAALFGELGVHGGLRPARRTPLYDDATLRRALEAGVGSDGRELGALMPRFRLGDHDAAALLAYLHTLGDGADAGVSATEVRLATIVADSAPVAEREAVTRVLERFAAIKNSGTRREVERAAASRRQLYGERHIRAFRRWRLDVWRLSGPPAGWRTQLEKYYAAGAPFAVVSGAVGDEWATVHEFCEQRALPCVMPVTSLPASAPANRYNVYYSAGVLTEANVTARELLGDPRGARQRVLLLYPDNARGRAARGALESAWRAGGGGGLVTRALAPGTAPGSQDWLALLRQARPDSVVAWLDATQLREFASVANGLERGPQRVLTAESFTDWEGLTLPAPIAARLQHVYPYRLPAPGRAQFPREESWLKSQRLDALARIPAAKALFACHATGEAMAAMADSYSREYLIETLEHMLDGSNMTTLYPLTTLGTGQRLLAKGAYVARPGTGGAAGLYTDSHWVQL